MDQRLQKLRDWLTDSLSVEIQSLAPASQDASFRRYFRITSNTDGLPSTLIAMDAPPAQESLHEFISIAQALASHKLHVPKIFAINLEHGFLLLEDLGNRNYLDELLDEHDRLYHDAIDALISIQSLDRTNEGCLYSPQKQTQTYVPPTYNQSLIDQELDLFIDWYCEKHLQASLSETDLSVWADLKQQLVEVFQQQPYAWVHRDYHSRNLMITNNNSPGIIDFQDMVWGPISYDFVSLFKDCYIEWPRDTQLDWLRVYHEKCQQLDTIANVSFDELIRWFDLTGLQRHLKVLGIFCRLNYRDNKNHYLLDLPLVEKYVLEVLNLYPELKRFKHLFESLTQTR